MLVMQYTNCLRIISLLLATSLSLIKHKQVLVQVLSPGPAICRSVCLVHCDKMADCIWIVIGVVGPLGPGMTQVVGIDDCPTGRGSFVWILGVPL